MILRLTPEELSDIETRIKAQSRTYTHEIDDEDDAVLRQAKPRDRAIDPLSQTEAVVMRECARVLDGHPEVAFWWRQNVGGGLDFSGRFIKFAFKGCADLLGCSKTGRFLAVEVKKTGGVSTKEQAAFLANVNQAGGLGVCVDHAGKLALALREL